ncbi:MAG TPA: tripartite tricarboxylate transporter substrate binding protein [Burkholderiales bacterium]
MRQIPRLLAAMLLALAPLAASAQNFPSRTVRVIVPYPPGGTVDAVARVVAQQLTEQMGQSFVIDNRAGANGAIGSEIIAKSAPDGYNLLIQASTFVANPLLQTNLPYDLKRDFTPISNIGSVPLIVTAFPGIPPNNLQEFITQVRETPDRYSFAAPPVGAAAYLAEQAIKSQAKLQIQLIPYKGTTPALTDVMGGHVSAVIDALPSSYPQVKGGKLKPLAVTSPRRLSFLPNVPTVAESGLPGFDMVSWYGMWAPANMPKDLATRLATEVNKAVHSKLAQERLADQGFDAIGSTPDAFRVFIDQEYTKYARIIKDANIKIE